MKKQTFKLFAMVAVFATLLFAACKKETTSPVADFSYSFKYSTRIDTFYFGGDSISFINLSKDADTYLWNFGDGTTSTEKNPKIVYQHTTGQPEFVSFPISLTATKDGKSSTKTKTLVGWWD